ncbi:YheT family hydrolase [Aquabacterium sp.]|uniref:YheT family hydrolase n=1 Tax=Aquabacterium sp. TaxID=1872578 RepID=UPI003D6C92FD
MELYKAPRWLAGQGSWGGNAQTIWPALFSRPNGQSAPSAEVSYQRQRWDTPDGDFIDVDLLPATTGDGLGAVHRAGVPLLVLFHGLEGSSRSHYALAFAHWAQAQGWSYAVPHFRGCSGELNLGPRSYHSGDFVEIDWILRRLLSRHGGPMVAVGISMGGNALLRWAQEAGSEAIQVAKAVAAVSSPLDLAAAGDAIGRGFNRQVYTRMFLKSMKPKALAKLAQFPGLFDEQALRASRDLFEFDNVFTAPLHGFSGTPDYWARCSSQPGLKAITGMPALVLNARNDPFIPGASLPRPQDVGPWVTLWQPEEGGHVGFPAGPMPGHVSALPQAVGPWLAQHL